MSDKHRHWAGEVTEFPNENESDEVVPLQADLFSLKMKSKVRPRPANEDDPDTWDEVWPRVNKHLMSFVTNIFGVLPDTAKATRSLLRGIGNLAGAMAERVGRSHEQADKKEETLQAQIRVEKPVSVEYTPEALEDVIAKLRASGICPVFEQLSNGTWAVIAVRPELEDAAKEAAQRAITDATNEKEGFPPADIAEGGSFRATR